MYNIIYTMIFLYTVTRTLAGQLITHDAELSTRVAQAVQVYVRARNAAWRAQDVCPATCNGAGSCATAAREDTCACTDPSRVAGRACSVCRYGSVGQCGGRRMHHAAVRYTLRPSVAVAI